MPSRMLWMRSRWLNRAEPNGRASAVPGTRRVPDEDSRDDWQDWADFVRAYEA
jgi:hypothetical protein